MPSLDLSVALGIVKVCSYIFYIVYANEILEVPRDELGPLSLMIRGETSGEESRARWMIVWTSLSSIFGRISSGRSIGCNH
jgi:hypothetical protein